MKEKVQKYNCKNCNIETVGKKEFLEGFCANCRLIKSKVA